MVVTNAQLWQDADAAHTVLHTEFSRHVEAFCQTFKGMLWIEVQKYMNVLEYMIFFHLYLVLM